MTNLFDIKGNVTVITGGTGVLGRAIARYLALNGAYVIILGRKESTGAEIVADTREAIAAEKASGSIEFLKTDVMEREVLENNLQYIIEHYGRVDTLLNAAGGNMPGAVINPDKTFFDMRQPSPVFPISQPILPPNAQKNSAKGYASMR